MASDRESSHNGATGMDQPGRDPDLERTDPKPVATVSPDLVGRDVGSRPPGERIGGYQIVRLLGAGGMGEVYLATDEHLQRQVAVKVVRPGAFGADRAVEARDRLLREAQAMARLAHPNVVVVHEAGLSGNDVFVAMEYVEGTTLRGWLAAQARPWREIVRRFAEAGRGLAAAHRAGLVHRDFKPDNVLIGDDGRVRVSDFGLAGPGEPGGPTRPGGPPDDDDGQAAPGGPRGGDTPADADGAAARIPTARTVRGDARGTASTVVRDQLATYSLAIAGTPRYMAPEQHAGRGVDARSDQFAFCVALWEAITGRPPFPADTYAALRAQVEAGTPVDADGARPMPSWVRAILTRGLGARRDDRYPSMDALLAALGRDPAVRRRRVIAGVVAVALVAAGGAGAVELAQRGAEPCADGAARIAAAWSPARADLLAHRFAAAGAATAWPALRARLDAYARAWAVAQRDACRATRVDGSQSEAMLDRRMTCLAQASARLDAVAAVLERGSKERLASAADALLQLPDLASCANTALLGGQRPLPADPVARARLDEAIKLVAKARASELDLTVTDEHLADRALAAARASGWLPEIADATRVRAVIRDHLESPAAARPGLQEAAILGLESGADDAAAWSMADLAWNLAGSAEPDQAALWIAMAKGMWTRVGEPPALGVRIAGAEALRALDQGDPVAGLAATREQVRLARIAYPGDEVSEAGNHYDLAQALSASGTLDEAAAEIAQAIELDTRAEGPDRPRVIVYLGRAAEIALHRGRMDEAIADNRHAVAIAERWFAPGDLRVAGALENLGLVLSMLPDPAAIPAFERAIAIRSVHEPGSVWIAGDEAAIATTEAGLGHLAPAIERGQRALAELEKIRGPEHPELVDTLVQLGYCERGLGRLDASEQHLRRAVAIAVKAFGPKHYDTVNPRIELGHTLIARRRFADALAVMEPAMALADADANVPPAWTAELRLAYADGLWRSGGDRTRARSRAIQARDGYAALGGQFAAQAKETDAWLHAHGGDAPPGSGGAAPAAKP
jgi:eukaryotic-like serine/threonine-protein kinase